MLVYVGNSAPVHDLLAQEINRLGLADKTRITGHVSMSDFYKYIQISDVCLNLRYPSNGESSASLMRILSAGKPVVVTDIGSFADFPDETNGMGINPKSSQASTAISKQKYLQLHSELRWSENKSKAWKEVAKQLQIEIKKSLYS